MEKFETEHVKNLRKTRKMMQRKLSNDYAPAMIRKIDKEIKYLKCLKETKC